MIARATSPPKLPNHGARGTTSALRQGTPPALIQGTPALRQGTPALLQGTPALRQGTPALLQGTPALLQGAPALRQGTPALLQGNTPALRQGTPAVVPSSNSTGKGGVRLAHAPAGQAFVPSLGRKKGINVVHQAESTKEAGTAVNGCGDGGVVMAANAKVVSAAAPSKTNVLLPLPKKRLAFKSLSKSTVIL